MARVSTEKQSAPQHFFTLLKKFDVAMLLSNSGRDLRARPMAIVQIDAQGTIWFFSSLDAERTRALEEGAEVGLICQSERVYLSLAGESRIVRDRAKIDELWKETYKVWFPEGRDAPDLALIAVTPVSGEFWDQSGGKGIQYLFNAARAYVQGEEVKPDPGMHADTPIDERPAKENQKGVR